MNQRGMTFIGWLGWIAFAAALVSAVIVYQSRQKVLADLAIVQNRVAGMEQEAAAGQNRLRDLEMQIEGLIKRNQQLDEQKRASQADSARAIEELTQRAGALEAENEGLENKLREAEAELTEAKQELAEARVAPVLQSAQS
ncbi:MAG: hypothetical protein HY714_04945 [Candidatus Omnitrophica bacterium]|nr:hypothetical protein [Candidatus Omnitrophota bacterium]